MTIHLPKDLEASINAEVFNGHYASADDVVTEAVRLFLRHRAKRSAHSALTPDELNRQLLDAGVISHLPARPELETYQEFTPIAVEGEPLSETIIRERR